MSRRQRRTGRRLTPAERNRRKQSFILILILFVSLFVGMIAFLTAFNK